MAKTDKNESAKERKAASQTRRQELEHHLRTSPTDLDGFMELAAIYRSENRPQEAKRILQQAKKIFPEDEKVAWEYEEAVLARSLQQLREVTDLDNRLSTAETERELQRSMTDWASRRIEVCRARLGRDPSLHHFRIVMAEAMADADMHEKAISILEPLTKIDDYSSHAYLIKGRCQLAVNKDVEAMASLRAASIRRAVNAPPKVKIAALRLLCDTAERLGVELTLNRYREILKQTERQLQQS